jgi:hypothetical protein
VIPEVGIQDEGVVNAAGAYHGDEVSFGHGRDLYPLMFIERLLMFERAIRYKKWFG